MLNAVIPAELAFVPPFATGRVPVTPVVSGSPVRFVATPDDGVPRAGVTKTGEVAKTSDPLPVSLVTAAAILALVGVPRDVATPPARPLTPVETGNPVPLVSVTAEGVPRFGVVSTGEVESVTEPEPVVPFERSLAAN